MSRHDLLMNIVKELRSHANFLLDEGIDEKQAVFVCNSNARRQLMPGFSETEELCRLIPNLLSDLSRDNSKEVAHLFSHSPIHAVPSKSITDNVLVNAQMVPKRWQKRVHQPRLALRRWLYGILTNLEVHLADSYGKIKNYRQECIRNLQGSSVYAKNDLQGLNMYFERISFCQKRIRHATQHLKEISGGNLTASQQIPTPYPSLKSWQLARTLVQHWQNPDYLLPNYLKDLLTNPVEIAHLSFLYQRWVGLKIVQSLQSAGWDKQGNELVAIFLGGKVRFLKGNLYIDLWCEPRLTKDHDSGFTTYGPTTHEMTPDYMLVTSGPQGSPDCFILDPTLCEDHQTLKKKAAKYTGSPASGLNIQSDIRLQHSVKVAGCLAPRLPVRSWVVTPTAHASILDVEGRLGQIPLDPIHFSIQALTHFIDDIERHAFAWCQPHHSLSQ